MVCRSCPLVTDEVTILEVVQRTRDFFEEQLHLLAPKYPSIIEERAQEPMGPRAQGGVDAGAILMKVVEELDFSA